MGGRLEFREPLGEESGEVGVPAEKDGRALVDHAEGAFADLLSHGVGVAGQ